MGLIVDAAILDKIHAHGQRSYPEEGAGLLLGSVSEMEKSVTDILAIENAREDAARHNRYLLTAQDYMHGEEEAARRGLDVLGVFHSHPDHPDQPSEFDREWAMPWFSYLITRVDAGKAISSRSWRLLEDRSQFFEEEMKVTSNP